MLKLVRGAAKIRSNLLNRIIFHLKQVDFQANISDINGVINISGSGKVSISPGTRMNSGYRNNPIGGDTILTLACRAGGVIEIGPNCGLSNCAIVADEKVTIGPEVMIGGGAKIYDTDFHHIDPHLRRQEMAGSFHGTSRPVIIGRNAFIGAHSIILKGVSIGENSVVGAGSVVTQSIPDNEIWAGNPARYIKSIHLAEDQTLDFSESGEEVAG